MFIKVYKLSSNLSTEVTDGWHLSNAPSLITRPSNISSMKPEGTLYFVLGKFDKSGADPKED